MKRILFTAILCLAGAAILPCGGCASATAIEQASELRMLFKEVQTQAADACNQPGHDEKKCAELQANITALAPIIDQIELVASKIPDDPGQQITFQSLWVIYKPQIESLLIRVVLNRYLG